VGTEGKDNDEENGRRAKRRREEKERKKLTRLVSLAVNLPQPRFMALRLCGFKHVSARPCRTCDQLIAKSILFRYISPLNRACLVIGANAVRSSSILETAREIRTMVDDEIDTGRIASSAIVAAAYLRRDPGVVYDVLRSGRISSLLIHIEESHSARGVRDKQSLEQCRRSRRIYRRSKQK